MAMSTRAKWMASVIADIFQIGEYDAHVSSKLSPISIFMPNVIGIVQEPQVPTSVRWLPKSHWACESVCLLPNAVQGNRIWRHLPL